MAALAALTFASAGTFHRGTIAHRRFAEVFITGQFTIAVFIERLQGRTGVSDFIGINHAVIVRIEGFDECGLHPGSTAHAVARTVLTAGAARPGIILAGRAARILGKSGEGKPADQRSEREECFCFHSVILCFCLSVVC